MGIDMTCCANQTKYFTNNCIMDFQIQNQRKPHKKYSDREIIFSWVNSSNTVAILQTLMGITENV